MFENTQQEIVISLFSHHPRNMTNDVMRRRLIAKYQSNISAWISTTAFNKMMNHRKVFVFESFLHGHSDSTFKRFNDEEENFEFKCLVFEMSEKKTSKRISCS